MKKNILILLVGLLAFACHNETSNVQEGVEAFSADTLADGREGGATTAQAEQPTQEEPLQPKKTDPVKNPVQENEENPWEVQSVDGQTLTFRNGQSFTTNLYDLDYIGQLEKASGKAPFLILAGKPCEECDANRAIYFHSPSEGPMPGEEALMRYPFPGKELYYEDGSLLNESRFFFGEVMPGVNGAIWYQNTKVEEGQFVENAYLVQVENGKLKGTQMLKEEVPDIDKTLQMVEQEKALEVPGVEYFSEP